MTKAPLTIRVAQLIHRISISIHPSAFRREFRLGLIETFDELANEVYATRGSAGVVALLVRTLLDTCRTALFDRASLRSRAMVSAPVADDRHGAADVIATVAQDITVGIRMLVRRPVFAGVAIGTLALGIGANTAIFSVVNSVLLRPLPFPQPEQLVRVYHANTQSGNRSGSFSLPDREEWAERTTSLSALAVYTTLPSGLLLTGGEEPVELRTAYVSADFFDVFRRDAYLGRVLLDEEEYGANRVVVLSHAFWQQRYGGDESVVGNSIQLDDASFLVAGVMPTDFSFPARDIEAWVFLTIIPESSIPLQIRQVRFLNTVGRIEGGTSVEQATEELTAVASALALDFPEDSGNLTEAEVVPLHESMTSGVEATLFLLLGIVGLVLMIACANVANLLLSRGVERERELSVRRAIGASRGRLIRQLMTESLLLGVVGGAAGVVLAYWGTGALLAGSGELLPRSGEIGMDRTVLLFSVLMTGLTALAFGLIPAMKTTRSSAGATQHGAGRVRGHRVGTSRTWGALVAGQVGLAMLVVIASGLLMRSLWALQSVDVGMDSERLVALSITINDARYPERPAFLALYEQLMTRLEALPGVESAASIRYLPLRRDGESTDFEIPDRPTAAGSEGPSARLLQVSPGFFQTAGVPLTAGRDFTRDDRAESPTVMIINDALRRRYWPGETPVGQYIQGPGGGSIEIVGLVGDVHQQSLAEDPLPTLYVPQAQNPRRGMAFVLRATSDPATLLPAVVAAVREVDPDQPIEHLAVMNDVVRSSTAQPRFFSLVLMSFAVLSLILASFGVYGVVSHSVSTRVSEIGIRVALGAPRTGVVKMVVWEGMRPVLIGGGLGLLAAVAATRVMSAILFSVSPWDPVTFVTVPPILLAAGLLACWLPAGRAVRMDPTQALRAE